MDAVALFPSLSGRTTAEIVRRRVMESRIQWEGFNWKKAAIYILANKHLVGKISRETRKFLPLRKKSQGVTPGMGSKGLSNKEKSEEEQWFYPRKDPAKQVIKEMISMVAQIGVRVLWETYCYDFGGKTFLQKEGGPIGQRPTMAASRLVMEEFFLEYRRVLVKAGVKVMMVKVYVDDGRQLTTMLRKGLRYDRENNEYRWDMIAEEEDLLMEKQGESKDDFMARLCLPLMNAINDDLTFTAETASDFADGRLPTLDFSLRQREEGELTHSYYEKTMKSQVMLERDSAMSTKQKITIQANELTRRLYNIDEELPGKEEEVVEIVENFTRQLKNSGWNRKEAREMVVSGYKGWRRRLERRKEEGANQYRSAGISLMTRSRKKLTGREDWFRDSGMKRKREDDDEEPRYWKKTKTNQGEERKKAVKTISVMFIPCTRGGELAKRMREAEEELGKQTGYKIKKG